MKPDRVYNEVDQTPVVRALVRLNRELLERLERAEFEIARLDGLVAGLGGAFIGDGVPEGDPDAHKKIDERLGAVKEQVVLHNEAHPNAIKAETLERGQRWLAYLLDRAAALERGTEQEERPLS